MEKKEEKSELGVTTKQPTMLEIYKKDLALVVLQVNKLLPFELSGPQVVDWTDDIIRLAPDVEADRLKFLFDLFKTEQLLWDRNKGIQNIFTGLKFIGKNEQGYYLRKRVW